MELACKEQDFTGSIRMLVKRIFRIFLDRKAVNNVISTVILTGAVIALSLAVFGWSESRSLDYSEEFAETVDAETARLKEKLVSEYVFYGDPSFDVSLYVLNCGTIDDVQIKSVHVVKSVVLESFLTPTLYLLNGVQIPDQDLDVGEEAYFVLSLTSALSSGYYSMRIVTVRGAIFYEDFVV